MPVLVLRKEAHTEQPYGSIGSTVEVYRKSKVVRFIPQMALKLFLAAKKARSMSQCWWNQ